MFNLLRVYNDFENIIKPLSILTFTTTINTIITWKSNQPIKASTITQWQMQKNSYFLSFFNHIIIFF